MNDKHRQDLSGGGVNTEAPGESGNVFATVEEAIERYRNGELLILVDDEDRENEGDLVFAASHVTPEKINFLARYGRGLICVATTLKRLEELGLRPLTSKNTSRFGRRALVGSAGTSTTATWTPSWPMVSLRARAATP
jgi:3,4-dihydroxy-2-butanone 4-phosphate synthase